MDRPAFHDKQLIDFPGIGCHLKRLKESHDTVIEP
jgi:hypothetical protein